MFWSVRLCVVGLIFATWLVPQFELLAAEYLVADRATNQILRYDSTSGTQIGSLVGNNMETNGGLFLPAAMVYGFDGDLFLTSIDLQTGDGRILRYNSGTGEFSGVFAAGLLSPAGLLYHEPSDSLLVGSLGSGLGDTNVIARLARNGSRLPDLAVGPASGRTGMILGPDQRVYVSSFAEGPFFSGSVLAYRYDGSQNEFQLDGPFAVAPQLPFSGANGLAFDATGDLFAAGLLGQSVVRFDVEAGTVQNASVLANVPYPSGVLIENDENILVTSLGNNNPNDPIYMNQLFPGSVFRIKKSTGEVVGQGPFMTGGAEFQPTTIIRRAEPGDYDFDGILTAFDIDALTSAWHRNSADARYDLNGDRTVNDADRTAWVEGLKQTYFGDSNLDGEFSSLDLIVVFVAGQYEDNTADNSTWRTGDWNGDGDFTSGDLVKAFQSQGYEAGPRPASAVPEPASVLPLLLGIGLGIVRDRRKTGQN